jgi:hypothetical protein
MIKYKGGDGSSKENAVIILGANNEIEGVDAEYLWLEENHGEENVEWEILDQTLLDEGDRQFDILKIKFSDGKMEEYWFEITGFYGK